MENLEKAIDELRKVIESIRLSQIEMIHRLGSNTAVLVDVSNGLDALIVELKINPLVVKIKPIVIL